VEALRATQRQHRVEGGAMTSPLERFKGLQRNVWASGDYPALARQYEDAAEDLVARLPIRPRMRVLDICTGTGNAAIAAAKSGGVVTGIDLTPELFDEAHARADALGLRIRWREGDAEELPYPDASFDAALSTFGVMYSARPRVAAGELVRVLRPGGRFGLCNWLSRGMVGLVFDVVRGYLRTDGDSPPSPARWGDPEYVRELFDGLDTSLEFDRGAVSWVFADPEDAVRYMEEVSGPVIAARHLLERRGVWPEARARMIEGLRPMVREDVGGCWVRAEYLVVIGERLTRLRSGPRPPAPR
jgi:SAM-dependent methyltransferase